MPKVTLDTNIEKIVEDLPMEEKLKLVYKLEKETLRQRWNNLLKLIDERLKKHPISNRDIIKGIECARKEHYAKRRH